MAELSDDELWRSVEHTVEHVLLPAIDPTDEWARAAAIQLIGLARYGRTRAVIPEDPAELISILHRLSANPLVNRNWRSIRTPADLEATLGAVLADAANDDTPAGDEIRTELRPFVVARLDAELAATQGLIPYFRGQLDP